MTTSPPTNGCSTICGKDEYQSLLSTGLKSFLANHRTSILLQVGTSREQEVAMGISQGSPLSPILYLFYNADMFEGLPQGVLAVAYVDDIRFLTWAPRYGRTTTACDVLMSGQSSGRGHMPLNSHRPNMA
jgi:hypothetical protein